MIFAYIRDGKPLEEKPEKVVVKKEGRKRSIVIKEATKEDIAEYTCVAENVKTKTELELKGSEEQIEAVEQEVKEQVATKGQDMTFRVDFKKELHRKPNVKLMKNGTATAPHAGLHVSHICVPYCRSYQSGRPHAS